MKFYPWLKRLFLTTILVLVLYQAGPSMAAVFKIGDRQGPVIYDKERHSSQYNLAHEVVHGNKARISLVMELSDRPYFYGLDRRPKPKKEREEIIKRLKGLPRPIKQQLSEAHSAMGD